MRLGDFAGAVLEFVDDWVLKLETLEVLRRERVLLRLMGGRTSQVSDEAEVEVVAVGEAGL